MSFVLIMTGNLYAQSEDEGQSRRGRGFDIMRFDENKDGKVSKDEVPERLRSFFSRMDPNGDDVIDAKEIEERQSSSREASDESRSGRSSRGDRSDASGSTTYQPRNRSSDDKDTPAAAMVDGKLRFAFRYQPWSDVLDWFAENANLSLHANEIPSGTCNYTDPDLYTPDQALDRINELMIAQGFILIRKKRSLYCWPLEKPIPTSLVPQVPVEELDARGENEMVTVHLSLKRLLADEAGKQVEKLKGPFGKVVPVPSVNLIVISDTAANVRLIRDTLWSVDQSKSEAGLRVFQLQHAQAKEVATQVRDLLGIPSPAEVTSRNNSRNNSRNRGRSSRGRSRRGGGDWSRFFSEEMRARFSRGRNRGGRSERGRQQQQQEEAANQPHVIADTRTNRVLVAAPPDKLALVEQAIQTLDIAPGTQINNQFSSRVEVFRVTRNDPTAVVTFLTELMQEDPQVQLTADIRSSSIYVVAPPAQRATIRAVLAEMEGTSSGYSNNSGRRVLPTGTADPQRISDLIRELWKQTGSENPIFVLPAPTSSIQLQPNESRRVRTPQSFQKVREQNTSSAPVKTDNNEKVGVLLPETEKKGTTRFTALQTEPSQSSQEVSPQDSDSEQQTTPPAKTDTTKPPVVIRIQQGSVVIESEDEQALSRIERLLSAILPNSQDAPFYIANLYQADATQVAETMRQVLQYSTTNSSSATLLQIIPDTRTNSLLIVGATPEQRITVEQLVQVLDTDELEATALSRDPRIILVRNTRASQVADVLRDVFADFLTTNNNNNNGNRNNNRRSGRSRDMQSFFSRFSRGGFGGRGRSGRGGRGNSGSSGQSITNRMTLGVDETSNAIVVSAPQPLFEKVEDLVQQLDTIAMTERKSIRVVPVRLSNVSQTQSTLDLLFGSGDSASSNRNSASSRSRRSSSSRDRSSRSRS
ncbi:MAG: hypothetical protein MK103_14205, partial [Planctomycetes bacterium]|nr:hypothetical protein [Planctomycetota bacterium]